MKYIPCRIGALIVCFVASLFACVLHAAESTLTWVGAGSDANTENASNWQGSTTPIKGNNTWVFASGSNTTVRVNSRYTGTNEKFIDELRFTTDSSAYTITSAVPAGLGAAAKIVNEGTSVQVLNSSSANAFQLMGSLTFDVAAGGGIQGTAHYASADAASGDLLKKGEGFVTIGGNATINGNLTVEAGTLNLNGSSNSFIGDAVVQGGTLNVNGGSTFTGNAIISGGMLSIARKVSTGIANTWVEGGVLQLRQDINLAEGGTVYLNGGNLDLNYGGDGNQDAYRGITVRVMKDAVLSLGRLTGTGSLQQNLGDYVIGDNVTLTFSNNGLSLNPSNEWSVLYNMATGSNSTVLTGDAGFNVDGDVLVALGGNFDGAGYSITKTGEGMLEFRASPSGEYGNVTLNEGTIAYSKSATPAASTTFYLNGGRLSANSTDSISFASTMVLGGNISLGDATRNGRIGITGGVVLMGSHELTVDSRVAVGGVISENGGSFGFTKKGGSILHLRGQNTYTGATRVEEGSVVVTGRILGDVSVASGAFLYGAGTAARAGTLIIESGATLAPGGDGLEITNEIGTLNVGSLVLQAGAILQMQMDATGYDAIVASGSMTLGGSLLLEISTVLSVGQTYQLFEADSFSGDFEGITLSGGIYNTATSRGNNIWSISDGANIFHLDLTSGILAAIPEPSTYTLIIGAAVLLFAGARRRLRR